MKVLLDHMMPHGLRHAFGEHNVVTVAYRGWAGLTNGQLLEAAQHEFDAFITLDNSLDREQPITQYQLAVIVLVTHPATEENLLKLIPRCLITLNHIQPGRVYRIEE